MVFVGCKTVATSDQCGTTYTNSIQRPITPAELSINIDQKISARSLGANVYSKARVSNYNNFTLASHVNTYIFTLEHRQRLNSTAETTARSKTYNGIIFRARNPECIISRCNRIRRFVL